MSLSTLAFEYISDHAERAVYEMPSRWREKDRLTGLVYGCGQAVQFMEDYLYGVLDLSTLDNASGDQLDQWGDLVGEARGPLTDSDYRRFIRARLAINGWHDAGTTSPIDGIVDIWRTIMGAEAVFYVLLPPATFELVAVRPAFLPDPQADRVVRSMRDLDTGAQMILTEAVAPMLGFEGSTLETLYYSGGLLARRLYP